jgi:hypothetical protein
MDGDGYLATSPLSLEYPVAEVLGGLVIGSVITSRVPLESIVQADEKKFPVIFDEYPGIGKDVLPEEALEGVLGLSITPLWLAYSHGKLLSCVNGRASHHQGNRHREGSPKNGYCCPP